VSVEVPDLQAIADRIVARARAGEQIEAYVSRGGETSVRVYEGEVEHFVSAQSEGVGIRVIRDGRTGFAYAGTLEESALAEVLRDARDNVEFGTVDEWAGLAEPDGVAQVAQKVWDDDLAAWPTDGKIDIAKELERRTLAADPRVRTEETNYDDGWGETAVATTTGIRESGRGNSCFVSVVTLADDGDETQTGFGFSVGDSPRDFDLDRAAREGAERATRLLGATKPASRRTTVVLDPYVTSQFVSVLSSALSGESVAKGRSIFRERLGERVAAPCLTLVDDPTNPRAYTKTDIDGEGLAARRNVLIEDGILKGYLQDTLNARLMKVPVTGNGRRECYAHVPMPRMTNTAMEGGDTPREEMIASTKRGLYCANFGGGQVDITNGKFVFQCTEAYLIEDGRITRPVKGATLIGNGPEVMTRVSMVGNDLSLDAGVGICGKDGQSVPVGVGQPTLRIEGLTVGGTA